MTEDSKVVRHGHGPERTMQTGIGPAPVRRTKGCLSQETAKLMVFKLINAAAKTWRRLNGENRLPKVIRGVTFRDGVEVTDAASQDAA